VQREVEAAFTSVCEAMKTQMEPQKAASDAAAKVASAEAQQR